MNIQPIIEAVALTIQDNPVGFMWFCVLALIMGFITTWIIIDKIKS